MKFVVSKRVSTNLLAILLIPSGAMSAADFASEVWPVLQKAGCSGCHNLDGVASGTRLKFPEAKAPASAITNFGNSLSALIDRANPAQSLLLTKPTRRVAHAGGKKIQPGSAEEATLQKWIEEFAKTEPSAATVAETHDTHKPVGPVLRRLTHAQYNNTVRDLLGDDSRIADSFPPEDFVNGFKNQYQSQTVSPLLAEAYTIAAEKLAKKAFAGDTSRIVPCKPASAADVGCRDTFIKQFGQRAFRRPLTTLEVDRYRRLFATGSKGSFMGGARIVVEAMLQSPNFLQRSENGLQATWRPYETASRLSYFLWNTMPDAELFRSAESGELNTSAGVERAARRMLKEPKARDAMNEFLAEWLRFDRLLGTVKDRRTFPMFTPELSVSMVEETKRLFGHLVWNNANFMEFYSADGSFLTSDLAALYGVAPPPKENARVTFPASSERAGILGQATFLALTSKPADTSPTARGLFVREQFLCQEVPQPPPGVSSNLPALTKAKPQTNRERLAMHLNNESCSSCHQLIDPIGFGLEKFDAIGQQREKQTIVFRSARGEKEAPPEKVELPLDTTGEVAGIKDSAFSSPRELGKILAGSSQCQECVVKQLFRYAAGRHETAPDRVVIRKAYEDFKKSGFLFQDLLVSLSKWMIVPPGGDSGIGTD
jgi:hypothetical protein